MPYLDNVVYTAHVIEQIDRRGIPPRIVEAVLKNGEVIEEYDSDEEARYLMHFSGRKGLNLCIFTWWLLTRPMDERW